MNLDSLFFFGIRYDRLSIDNYLKILEWRNKNFVRKNFIDSKLISYENHAIWFNSLHNLKDYIYIVSQNNEEFGVFSIRNIDLVNKIGESGSYLSCEKFINTGLAARAGYGLAYIAFDILNLKGLYCRVLKSNKNALNFNIQQGFDIIEDCENYFKLQVSKEKFYNNKINARIIKFLVNNNNI
jgi:UDP-4-amino-4,6-dideoxy-N-acetyl-beta-L-altrosamine N-acetyltransferase